MTTHEPEAGIAEVAASLSEAQRAFLLWLPGDGSWHPTTEEILSRHGPNALRGFGKSGLIEGYYREEMRHRLTVYGKTVRQHLARAQGERDDA